MGKIIDLTGKRYGMLVVLEYAGKYKSGGTLWKCKCDCGNTVVVRSNDLRTGNTKSCGCFKESSRFGRQFIDLTGQRFGKLTVIRFYSMDKHNHALWECKCDCGNIFIARSYGLRNGDVKSCGCIVRRGHTIPKISKSPIYRRWKNMIERCYNPKVDSYPLYGGRGITVCDEWKDDVEEFYRWAIDNGFSPELSIDRIDNDGPYAPWNCRWVDDFTQARNKRNSVTIKVNGEHMTLSEFLAARSMARWQYQALRSKMDLNGVIHSILNPELGLYQKEGIYYDKEGFMVLVPRRVYIGKKLMM